MVKEECNCDQALKLKEELLFKKVDILAIIDKEIFIVTQTLKHLTNARDNKNTGRIAYENGARHVLEKIRYKI